MAKETIIQKVFDLLEFSIPTLQKFPRMHKFTLADRIQNQISDLLEIYIEAYYRASPQKKELLHSANIQLEKLRYHFRLCFNLGLIHSRKYQDFAQRIEEIGKMTGGWIKSLK